MIAAVLVEAKLYAPKSGSAGPEIGDKADEETPDPDQLVKYWQGLQRYVRPSEPCSTWIVYLTAHSSAPLGELADALKRLPSMRLGWLSWFDVFDVVNACDGLPARDLATLLEHKGFRGFSGFAAHPVLLLPTMGFWHPRISPEGSHSTGDDHPAHSENGSWTFNHHSICHRAETFGSET